MGLSVRVKSVREHPERSDGRRVLVDRLWPRGVSKGEAALDGWERELAPSDALRRWFGHDPERAGLYVVPAGAWVCASLSSHSLRAACSSRAARLGFTRCISRK